MVGMPHLLLHECIKLLVAVDQVLILVAVSGEYVLDQGLGVCDLQRIIISFCADM